MSTSPQAIAELTVAGAKAGGAIVSLILKAREQNRHLGPPELIRTIISETEAASKQQLHELRFLRDRLKETGVDLTKSADQISADATFWRLRQYFAIRAYRHKINALVDSMGDYYMDLIALAHCREAEDIIALSTESATENANNRRANLGSDLPLGEVIDQLVRDSEQLQNQLRNL